MASGRSPGRAGHRTRNGAAWVARVATDRHALPHPTHCPQVVPHLFLVLLIAGMMAERDGRPAAARIAEGASVGPPGPKVEGTGGGEADRGVLTFCKDIAPIVWQRCAPCHHPGQVAPFSLLTYADMKNRIRQIADITGRRLMPPWLPDSQPGEFEEDRRLTEDELGRLQQWISEGAVEGDPKDLATPPTWTEGWLIGKPDLVVTMPIPFKVPAEGRDIYRNFVLPVPIPERRYVRAVELRPGNLRVVHHAFMYIDPTRQSRRLAARQAEPGFPGMKKPDSAVMPEGQFLSYQPGKRPSTSPEGMAWILEKDSDLVLQVHMNPTGKPEELQASVGFCFTDEAPKEVPFKVLLTSYTIDIAPGETNYVVEDSFTLPADVSVLSVLPHGHYLAREMMGLATLPDGTTRELLQIGNWDFNWQGTIATGNP